MKGFLLGVLCTLIVGGFFFHIQSNYGTMDPCTAVKKDLTSAVNAAIKTEMQKKTGSNIVGQVANALLKPVADPVIAKAIEKQTPDQNWFQCAFEIVKLDFLGQKSDRVAAIKKELSIP